MWNSLPDDLISASAVLSIELRSDDYWKDQDILYNYEAKLDTRLQGNCDIEEVVM